MNLRKFTPTFSSRWRHPPTIACLSLAWKSSKLTTALKLAFFKNDNQRSLLNNILHRTKHLSSTSSFFFQESNNLNGIFLKSRYLVKLINSTIHNFQHSSDLSQPPLKRSSDSPVRVTIPIKYQKSADVVRRRLCDLGIQINKDLQLVFLQTKRPFIV